jgi:Transposase domain (DUF772)
VITKSYTERIEQPIDLYCSSDRHFWHADYDKAELAPFYSHTGRPSVDPELMIRMLLVGYCYGLRSERRLCDETHLNLAYRWFCRLGLEGAVRIIPPFPKIGTAAFARAPCSAACSKKLWRGACGQDWSAAKALRSTPV